MPLRCPSLSLDLCPTAPHCSVVFIGAGPGSELLGFLQTVLRLGVSGPFTCLCMDLPGWAETYRLLIPLLTAVIPAVQASPPPPPPPAPPITIRGAPRHAIWFGVWAAVKPCGTNRRR